ncbi:efflux RND transporter permease subunit [Marinifilum caeruleilacunae]|uniref:Efflux RND transporter permease subunit n=1 Tax=Marinifilum caeruleilacunae TaxID=2499076 RepID=A0ABX1X175_9BACT|nr:efflux RND transporter permease subunit [Marinifilum caeruleilacunae]NOU62122.1 efflux RND transporter permease subunit [Marinifilum caeruleilacunae]
MNITKISIENNRVTILMVIVITLLGLMGYNQLPRDAMPPFTIRICQVVTQFPGASPERVERLVTDKIEEVIQEIPELKKVTSESRTGISIIKAELIAEVEKDELQEVWDRIRRKIDEIRDDLPSSILEPEVKDETVGVVYGIQLGLKADGFSYAEMKRYAEEIRDDLILLDEAARVEIGGIREERIFVEFDNARIGQYGLSASQIQNSISTTNIVFPGGQINLNNERIVLEPTGNYESIEHIKNTLIPIGANKVVKLSDIANVSFGYETPQTSIVKVDGKHGLSLAVNLKDGANLTTLGEKIDKKLKGYNESFPVGMSIQRVASQDYFVNDTVNNFVSNVLQSILIVLVVMLLFLGWRTGMVVASLIPATMVTTLMLMNNFGVGLNQVTLAALIMSLGMLVDNSIVVSESIMVKMANGSSAKDAAIHSCKELVIPLLISTLTTSSAFLAFFLAIGTMAEMTGDIFIVISFALLSSWILAFSFVALLSVYFIRVKKPKDHTKKENKENKQDIFEKLNARYKVILNWGLRRPKLVVVLTILLFIFSLSLGPKLPSIFMPDSDRNLVVVNINLPQDTKIEETENVVNQLSEYISSNLLTSEDDLESKPGVISYTSFIGKSPYSYDLGYQEKQPNSKYAHMLINTTAFEDNEYVSELINDYAFKNFPDAQILAEPLANAAPSEYDVMILVSGDDPDKLFSISEKVKAKMAQINGTTAIHDDWGPRAKKLLIEIDQNKASMAGISNQDIAISLMTAIDGYDVGDYRENDDNIPIVLQNKDGNTMDIHDLESIMVFSQISGKNVPLVQVASIKIDWQLAKIMRRNLVKTISINCDAKPGTTANEITQELISYLDEISKEWDDDYSYTLGGEIELSQEAFEYIGGKLPIAGFIILILLMLQFNSFRKSFIVLTTIPLGLIGVMIGLFTFGSYLGFFTFLGIVSLAGIVVNNAIVLLDRIEIELNEYKKDPYHAIVDAAQQRFRPILLTTFTTVLGLIPLYVGGGLLWEPMAIAIMIGLLFATLITLLFVPVLFKLLYKVKVHH